MLENVLAAGGARKRIYLDSGPGSKAAVGDSDVAYFGEVSNAEVFSNTQLQALIPELSGAAVVDDAIPWLKFLYYGKYLFIKKFPVFSTGPVASAISWKGLYEAGLIHGLDGNGPTNAGFPVDQIRLVKKDTFRFKVRTITSEDSASTKFTVGYGNDTVRHKSMFTELIYRCTAQVVPNYPEAKFEQYPYNQITPSTEVVRETLFNSSYPDGLAVFREMSGQPAIAGYRLNRDLRNSTYWRPVLELVMPTEIFQLKKFSIGIEGSLVGAVSAVAPVAADLDKANLVRLTNITIASANPTAISCPPAIVDDMVVRPQSVTIATNSNQTQASAPTATFNP